MSTYLNPLYFSNVGYLNLREYPSEETNKRKYNMVQDAFNTTSQIGKSQTISAPAQISASFSPSSSTRIFIDSASPLDHSYLNFETISRDILFVILSFLNLSDLIVISSVCKTWKNLPWNFIKKFSIANTMPSQWNIVDKMTRLHTLEIESNKQEIQPSIMNLSSLKKLCIQNAYYIKNEELQYITHLPKLESLSLSCGYSQLRLDFLISMNNIKKLCISRTRISPDGVEVLSKLNSIENLYLYRTDIIDSGVQKLSNLTNLRVLDIACNSNVTDTSVEVLCKMKRLVHIDVGDTRISTKGVDLIRESIPNIQIGLLPLYPLGRRSKTIKMW